MFGPSSPHSKSPWTTVVVSLALTLAQPTLAASGATFPLRTDAATRTLVGADGQPFLIAGDAAWSLIVQLTREEVVQYLDDRRARAFNTVLVQLIEHHYSASPPANRYGQQPFLTPGDFSTPNDAYFAHAEWVIDQAAQRGMLVLLTHIYLGWQGGDEGWYQELKANGTTKCRQYGRYIGQRFARYPNIIWVNGGDTPPLDGLPEVEAVIAGIKEYDTVHIHTAHNSGSRSALDDYDRPWLDLNAANSYRDCAVALTLSRYDYMRSRALTSFHVEGWYEGEGVSTACLLGQAYYPVLLGARGHVFGNRPIWLFDPGWQQALNSPGSQYMTHWSALLHSREGWGLVPDIDGRIVVSGVGNPNGTDFAAAARTPSGKSILVYVPTARTIGVDTSQVPGTSFNAWWFDARSGAAQQVGTYASGGLRSFTTPSGSPWVLVLDDTSAGLPAPGTSPIPAGPPFGALDTPAANASGITGSVAVTGWALDDTQVTKVQVYRNPVAGEPTSPNGKVFIGDATFVAGTRPDVAAAYPSYPNANRAGWGYMLLTYGLPAQGNGTYVLHAYASDAAGQTTLLGSKTITCSNATATKPFGTIDTPGQGQTVSGSGYVVFGWALTPQPGTIPSDGSTIWLTIDDQYIDHPVYDQYRSDIATGFPGYANTNGAVGYYVLDTTTLTNGIHTIGWLVTDSLGRAEGLGSRFFWVQN